ncbi:MAG: vitamin B12-dependent ribonucleotide reductase, partial [Candidatus Wallbacteria bacterium]|nr:vitamin B12-dependent ribonucleotide reductase [Candidatus Wallbacteria bacterium]
MTVHHSDVVLPRKLTLPATNGRSQKARKKGRSAVRGLPFNRRFTQPGQHPFDELQWEKRTAGISNERGESVFQQKDVEVPSTWSQMATNVVVSKYFRGALDTPARETSVKSLLGRVVGTIARWADEMSWFASQQDLEAFSDELTYLLVNQHASFNSPVW